MKVTINNTTYIIKWSYNEKTTYCHLYNENTSYQDPIIKASATLAKNDKFNKNTGRRVSLQRVLKEFVIFSKEDRRIIWQEYFKESPKRLKNGK